MRPSFNLFHWLRQGLHHVMAWSVTAVFLLPLFWLFVVSLRQPGLPPPATIEWWPTAPHWSNYQTIFTIVPLQRHLLNSALVVAVAVPVTLLVASLAGFALSQLPRRSQRRLFILSLAVILVPGAAVWLLRFQILQALGLIDSLWALIVPAFTASNPLFVLLYYRASRQIPGELVEAARLEGGTAVTIWRRIIWPLSSATGTAVVVLSFVMYWSDFIGPVLYIYNSRLYTIPVGVQLLKQLDATNWPLLMAASLVMTAPSILVFLLSQNKFLPDLLDFPIHKSSKS